MVSSHRSHDARRKPTQIVDSIVDPVIHLLAFRVLRTSSVGLLRLWLSKLELRIQEPDNARPSQASTSSPGHLPSRYPTDADTAWTCRKRLVYIASLALRTGFGCDFLLSRPHSAVE